MIAHFARPLLYCALLCAAFPVAAVAQPQARCGELIELSGHNKTKLVYSFNAPENAKAAVVLLPGGPGFADIDASGCARKLKGNSLIRTQTLFQKQGFVTALVDAPSDHHGPDGLAGFRISPLHAEDIGKIVADLRKRTKLPVWVIGTSRGSISAANAASRLQGDAAPDGVVLTSPVTAGRAGGRKAWVVQTVFSLPLEAIKIPVLVVAHAADACIRTPPALAPTILARTNGAREQAVTLKSANAPAGPASVDACEGRSPHGFIGQEQEVTDGIVRFINGDRY